MLRAIPFIAATLAVAAFAASDATGRSLQRTVPQLVVQLPTADGFSRSKLASVILAGGMQKTIIDRLDLTHDRKVAVARLSHSAYAMEPLDATAVRNLGLLNRDAGREGRALALLNVAQRMTKRDSAVNSLLALHYAQAGDIDRALSMYDQALRTSTRARETVIPAMIQQMKSPDMVDPVARLLMRRPPWADHFWAAAPRYTDSHLALGAVRLALAHRGIAIQPSADRELVAALASSGNADLAYRVMRRVATDAREPSGVVRNAGFDRAPDFLPFDWSTYFDGSMTTDIDPRAGLLRVSVFGEGGGQAARQMVLLPDATYQLDAVARDWTHSQSGKIYFKVRCANPNTPSESPPVQMTAAKFSARIARPREGCVANWLTIYASPVDGPEGAALTIDSVMLSPATG